VHPLPARGETELGVKVQTTVDVANTAAGSGLHDADCSLYTSLDEEGRSAMRRLLKGIADTWECLSLNPPNVGYAKQLLVWADQAGDRFRPLDGEEVRPEAMLRASSRDRDSRQAVLDLMEREYTTSHPTPSRECQDDRLEKGGAE